MSANPDSTVSRYLRAAGLEPVGEVSPQAKELESKGWRTWLLTLFPFAFEEEFSADHAKFWELRFSVLLRIREQRKYLKFGMPMPPQFYIPDKEYNTLLILGRGLAKSSTIEASGVARAAILDGGYCLYVCEGQDQADEHISNCRGLIEHPESRLAEFYPKMVVDTDAKEVDGMKLRDATDIFITKNGWICRSKGLNASLRGLRKGNRRPDDIKIDDIDGVNDSIAVSQKKIKQLTASVLPTAARAHVTVDFGQNLIVETGVMNQVHTGKSDAFAERTTIGVSNTFFLFREGIEYTTALDEADGRVKHKITDKAVPTWAGVDIAQAQLFLNNSGLDTFLAEYQNSFEHQKSEKVFHAYNEARHIITWSQFERVFGVRYLPPHWQAKASADLGYSDKSLSAWIFAAASAQNTALPSRYFIYRTLTFTKKAIEDQAEKFWEEMFPLPSLGKTHFEASQKFADYPELFRALNTKPRCKPYLAQYQYNPVKNTYEDKSAPLPRPDLSDDDKAEFYSKKAAETFKSQIGSVTISHEKTGEQKTLARQYGIPAVKTKDFSANSGISEANHLLHGDFTVPHPFHEDEPILDAEGNPTGLYKLGSPFLFVVVDDDQVLAPRDDAGAMKFREQIAAQVYTEEELGKTGLTQSVPFKFNSDYGDSFRMFCASYQMPASAPKTLHEKFVQKVAEISPDAIITKDDYISPERQMGIRLAEQLAKERLRQELGLDEEDELFDDDEEVW